MPLPGAGCPWQCWLAESRGVAACQAVLQAALHDPGPWCQLGRRAAALPCALPRHSRLRHGRRAPGAGQPLPDTPSLFAGCAQFQERHHQRPAAPAGPSLQGEGRGWGCPVCPPARVRAGGCWVVAVAVWGVGTGPSAPGLAQSGGKGTRSRAAELLCAWGQAGPSPGCSFPCLPCKGRHVGVPLSSGKGVLGAHAHVRRVWASG